MATKLEVHSVPIAEIGSDQPVFSRENREYWQDNTPAAIVFASSSIRKAILLAFALDGYNLESIRTVPFLEQLPFDPTTATSPLELQQLIQDNIPNGDGELQESVYVGEFRGVPVYMVPQQGETEKNDEPLVESINKVADVQRNTGSKRVIIFASDSTGLINGQHLGKPRYYSGTVGRFAQGALDVDFGNAEEVAEYCRAYLRQFYSQDTEIIHNNAVFAALIGDDQLPTVARETSLTLNIRNVQQRLAALRIYLDSGGGGMFQQFFDWLSDMQDQLSDVFMSEVIAQLPEEQRPWAVIAHIMGMPAWALSSMFEELAAASTRASSDRT